MFRHVLRFTAVALFAAAAAGESPIAFTPEKVVWTDGPPSLPPGSKIAVLEGNPREDGIFTMRVRIPAGSALAPHWHPRHERVTILSGAAELGFGSVADPGAVKRYGPGSFYVNPPGVMHFLFFPEETEMQITGIGPWELFTTDAAAPPHAPPTASLNVTSLTPPAGSEIDADTALRATVEYAVEKFRPESFLLTFQFETNTPGRTFTVTSTVVKGTAAAPPPPPPRPPMLETAKGTATVTQALGGVMRHPELRRPIRARVVLQEMLDEKRSRILATSDWIEYR